MKTISKPSVGEFAPYTSMYIDLLPDDGRVLEHLWTGFETTKALARPLGEEQLLYRYAPNKWTIKEILAHIVNDERIYAYRALRFARGDHTELPGFEQDEYAALSAANNRSLTSILAEYEAVRRSTIALFNGLPDDAFPRCGQADGKPMSVRAAVYHIAGHERHHLEVIRDRYLNEPESI